MDSISIKINGKDMRGPQGDGVFFIVRFIFNDDCSIKDIIVKPASISASQYISQVASVEQVNGMVKAWVIRKDPCQVVCKYGLEQGVITREQAEQIMQHSKIR